MASNGHVIPGTPIAVDMFNMKMFPQAKIFFLSQFHSDHTVGLSRSWEFPIYASPLTSELLVKKIGVPSSLVKSLEFNEDHLISLDEEGFETITVTLFDANHCPGSAMFLFSGYFGDILYTGDFRYDPKMFENFQLPTIDVLYIDNTYCSPKCTFPKREDSIEQILQQIHICLVSNNRLFLGLDNLGKEDLLQKIAQERQCKICVSPARKSVLEVLGMSQIVTTKKSESQICVVPTNQISTRNVKTWNEEMKTHAILATARFCGFNFKPYASSKEIHVIPYSNHSSYLELIEFVKLVRPRTIVPIVGKHATGMFGVQIADRADMSIFDSFLDTSARAEFTIPHSVHQVLNLSESENTDDPAPSNKRKQSKQQIEINFPSASSGSDIPSNQELNYQFLEMENEQSKGSSNPEQMSTNSSKDHEMDCSGTSSDEDSSSQQEGLNPNSSKDNMWEIIHLSGKSSREVFLAE